MSNYLWLLDAGHGGVIKGIPQTAGKRSPDWEKGILYEGVSNRDILARLKEHLRKEGITFIDITPEVKDVSLRTRVNRINAIASSHPKCIVISLHSDAFVDEGASGWAAWTSRGETASDRIATVFYDYAKKSKFKTRTNYSDGDKDQEANFYILRKTICPAVLIENFFMTNKKDYLFLKSEKGKNAIARSHFNAIKHIEKNGY